MLHVKVWLESAQRICFEAKIPTMEPQSCISGEQSSQTHPKFMCVWGVSFYLLVFVMSFEIFSCLHNRFNYSVHELEPRLSVSKH